MVFGWNDHRNQIELFAIEHGLVIGVGANTMALGDFVERILVEVGHGDKFGIVHFGIHPRMIPAHAPCANHCRTK